MTAFLPSLRQLRYLVALHEQAHFGRAAAQCFVSQSTLSAGIVELERLLGIVLVERSTRVVRFTPVGERLVERARGVVRGVEDLAETARAAGQPLVGPLRLAVIPTIAPFLLPRVLPALRRDWPGLDLYLREASTPDSCAALHNGGVDCVLLALPVACGEVEEAEIMTEPLLLGVPEGEATRYRPPLAPREIDIDRLLLLADGHCLKDHALAACERPDLRNDAMLRGMSLHTLVQMVDHGLGTTLLPRMAIEAGILAGTRVHVVELVSDLAVRRIALVWRRGSPRAADFVQLAATIAAAARD